MRVVIDNRERAFIEIIQQKKELYPNIHVEVAPLLVGDMEVYMEDTLLYIWERKTLSDLLSSIKDGRYKEQCHRLTHTSGSSKVVYLIEGIMNQLNPSDRKITIGSISSLMFHKQFHVWRSTNVNDSVDTFLMICDKLLRDSQRKPKQTLLIENDLSNNPQNSREDVDIIQPTDISTHSYTQFVKKVKKENITPENIGEIFLCQIPDISVASAKALMQCANGNFSQLIQIVLTSPEMLETVKIECGPKTRKLSKKVLERLHQYLGNSLTTGAI